MTTPFSNREGKEQLTVGLAVMAVWQGYVYPLQFCLAVAGTRVLAPYILCFTSFPQLWVYGISLAAASLVLPPKQTRLKRSLGMFAFVAHRNVSLLTELKVVSVMKIAARCNCKQSAVSFAGIQSGKKRVISGAKRPALGYLVARTSALRFLQKAASAVIGMLKHQITGEQRRPTT